MSEADGVRAEVNVAIDLEERASSTLLQLLDDIGQLQAQLLLIGISDSSDLDLRQSVQRVVTAHHVIEGANSVLQLVRFGLEQWRDRL